MILFILRTLTACHYHNRSLAYKTPSFSKMTVFVWGESTKQEKFNLLDVCTIHYFLELRLNCLAIFFRILIIILVCSHMALINNGSNLPKELVGNIIHTLHLRKCPRFLITKKHFKNRERLLLFILDNNWNLIKN